VLPFRLLILGVSVYSLFTILTDTYPILLLDMYISAHHTTPTTRLSPTVSTVVATPANVSADSPKPAPKESFVASSSAIELAADPTVQKKSDAWHKEQIIYFPLTDRFKDGDPNNNFAVDRNHPAGFYGGDLKGLTEQLDYIKSLGATSIWLSPLADNTEQVRMGDYHGYGHHGYWIRDHYNVEEHQGQMADAQNLVKEAHERGLKVILDVVLNHVGPDHPFADDPAKRGWFHNEGGIDNWDDPRRVERGDLGGLPDLNQENPETYNYLLNNTLWWIEQTGVDGIRLDAVKHINKDFWSKFVPDVREKSGKDDLFVMGEVFHGDPNVVSQYQRAGIESLFDLPLYYTIRETLGQGESFKKIGKRFAEDGAYDSTDTLVTVLDNHDLPRFLSTAKNSYPGEGEKRLKQALAFQMTVRGVPSMYYGTESGFSGGHDPYNREMMEFDTRPDLKSHIQKLTHLRNTSEALQHGTQREMWTDDDVYAFSRATDSQEAIAIFHNGQGSSHREIPLRPESRFQNGQILVDGISGREFRVQDGRVKVDLEPLTPLVLLSLPKSL
jgi:alpha-amylase